MDLIFEEYQKELLNVWKKDTRSFLERFVYFLKCEKISTLLFPSRIYCLFSLRQKKFYKQLSVFSVQRDFLILSLLLILH